MQKNKLFKNMVITFLLVGMTAYSGQTMFVGNNNNPVSNSVYASEDKMDTDNPKVEHESLTPTYVDIGEYGSLRLTPYRLSYSQSENRELKVRLKFESVDEKIFKNIIEKNPTIDNIELPVGITRLGYSRSRLPLKCFVNNQSCELATANDGQKKEYFFEYDVLVQSQMADGVYPITYTLSIDDKKMDFTTYIQLHTLDNEENQGDLRISDISIPTSVKVEEPFDLQFRVLNYGVGTAKNVKISLELPEGIVNLSQQNFVESSIYSSSPLYTVRLKANSDISSKYHNIKIVAQTTSTDGKNQTNSAEQYTGTLVVGGTGGKNAADKTKPIILIQSVLTQDKEEKPIDKVIAGKDFLLNINLKNTSWFNLRNMKLTIVNEEGKIVASQGANSLYFASVPAGSTFVAKLPMTVDRTAEQKRTHLKLNFYYEYGEDKQIETTDDISLNVVQETKVEITFQDGIKNPNDSLPTNVPNFFPLTINNLGRTAWRNVKLTIKGEGIFIEQPSVVIGKIDAGTSQNAEANIVFQNPGKTDVEYILTFEDSSGEIHEEKKVVTYNIEEYNPEPLPDDGKLPEFEENRGSSWLIYILIILVILLSLGLIIYIRRAKAKKRQALLIDDED